MYTLYDFHGSGNGYKIRLLLNFLRLPFRYVEVDILDGGSRQPEFLARNPVGKIPVLEIAPQSYLFESNAILYYLAQDTPFLPIDRLARARVLQWMCFEQYSHEPNIATSRFIRLHCQADAESERRLAEKRGPGLAALAVMEQHLQQRDFFVGECLTIADIALYAYTHVAPEGGFELSPYSSIGRWLMQIAGSPDYVPITDVAGRGV